MDIQQLRYALALSQELHFNRAAQKLNVTQPTLSQGIKKLEDELGLPLFERSPRAVRLTEAGRLFMPYALRVLDEIKGGAQALREAAAQIGGTIKLAAIPTMCPYLMPPALIRIRRQAPRLMIELYEEKTADILEKLRSGELDLGVLALPVKDSGLASLSLGREPFYLAVSRRHRLARAPQVSLKQMQDERLLILQEGHCFGDQAMEYCKIKRGDPQIRFQGSSLTSVVRLAAAGEGVTLVPRMALGSIAGGGVRFLPLAHPSPSREVGVVWRRSAPLGKAHELCIEAIRLSLAASFTKRRTADSMDT